MKNLILTWAALASLSLAAADWRNLDEEHYRGGRKASVGYLKGKVVLVDRWGVRCPPCRALLPRLEQVWSSFKSKPFVLLGGHCAGWGDAAAVRALVAENKLTYSIYEDAGLAAGEPEFNAIPFLYVVDPTGTVIYKGHDERLATERIVSALTDYESPRGVAQWQRFLAFELDNLPAQGYNRLQMFKKKFPAEAKDYAEREKELLATADLKKVADLVLVAKKLKDYSPKTAMDRKRYPGKVKEAISRYSPLLKSVKDARLLQETKNSIADLKWTLAGL